MLGGNSTLSCTTTLLEFISINPILPTQPQWQHTCLMMLGVMDIDNDTVMLPAVYTLIIEYNFFEWDSLVDWASVSKPSTSAFNVKFCLYGTYVRRSVHHGLHGRLS